MVFEVLSLDHAAHASQAIASRRRVQLSRFKPNLCLLHSCSTRMVGHASGRAY